MRKQRKQDLNCYLVPQSTITRYSDKQQLIHDKNDENKNQCYTEIGEEELGDIDEEEQVKYAEEIKSKSLEQIQSDEVEEEEKKYIMEEEQQTQVKQVHADKPDIKSLIGCMDCWSPWHFLEHKIQDFSFRINFIDIFSEMYKRDSSPIIPAEMILIICAYWDELRKQHYKDVMLLKRSCHSGDIGTIQRIFKEGMVDSSVNWWFGWSLTSPFFISVGYGYIEIAQLFINKNPNIIHYVKPFDGTTCLHHAASSDQLEMCRLLICHGSDVNKRDKLGCTPLMNAAEIGSIEIIKLLIKNKADVNISNNRGWFTRFTAISYCLDSVDKRKPQYLECALCLLNNGANPNYEGMDTGRTILHIAAAFGLLVLIKDLIENRNAYLNAKDIYDKRPIDYAIKNNREDVVQYLTKQHELRENEGCRCILM